MKAFNRLGEKNFWLSIVAFYSTRVNKQKLARQLKLVDDDKIGQRKHEVAAGRVPDQKYALYFGREAAQYRNVGIDDVIHSAWELKAGRDAVLYDEDGNFGIDAEPDKPTLGDSIGRLSRSLR